MTELNELINKLKKGNVDDFNSWAREARKGASPDGELIELLFNADNDGWQWTVCEKTMELLGEGEKPVNVIAASYYLYHLIANYHFEEGRQY